MSNKALGEQVLSEWYDEAKKYGSPYRTFTDFKKFIDQNLGLTESIGNSAYYAEKNVGIDSVFKTVRATARSTQGVFPTFEDGYPKSSYILQPIATGAIPSITNLDFVKKAGAKVAADSVDAVAKVGTGIISVYVIAGAIGFGVAIYLLTRRK